MSINYGTQNVKRSPFLECGLKNGWGAIRMIVTPL